MIRFIPAFVLLMVAACATVGPATLPPTTPSPTCDFRMIDHNRRACAERGGHFVDPIPGSPSCGICERTETYHYKLGDLGSCTDDLTGRVTCTYRDEMPAR